LAIWVAINTAAFGTDHMTWGYGTAETQQSPICHYYTKHIMTSLFVRGGGHRSSKLASYPLGTGPLSPGVSQQGREVYHSPPTIIEVRKTWIYTTTPPHKTPWRSA
jgi:hypothetical protein